LLWQGVQESSFNRGQSKPYANANGKRFANFCDAD
jgi:hypothetical protein